MSRKAEYDRVLDDAQIAVEKYGLDRIAALVADARKAVETELKADLQPDAEEIEKVSKV